MEDFTRRIAQVREDREHGSRWLVHETISILYDLATSSAGTPAERMRQLQQSGQELAQARPAMAAIAGAVVRVLGAPGGLEEKAQMAEQLLHVYDTAVERITAHARPLLSGTLITHSLSGTVLEVLTACASRIDRVIVLEGRPRYEGRDVAIALSKAGIAVTLITDAQAAIFLPECHAVVIGADSVLANGDVLNKAVTALVAWAARGYRIPLYVLCETLKISPHVWTGNLGQLEEKEATEVWEQPAQGVTVHNFYFDRTPARLVTTWITEQGTMKKQDIQRQAAALKKQIAQTNILKYF